ncbi:VOC family protein [Streptomyces sp. JJ36]|uniref:VOC family protein n=1 Tax=Streptomyces sp. JJ36 TaxID=2736645 RepID=UPI001F1D547A|nr:VOC family protein [Streptomyces sp. JJ36]MCF6525679.1 VOC family protein [Streptomyces sp. JJ36]
MTPTRVFAIAPVGEIDRSAAWYERLFGRPADRRPMPGLADWHLTETGWVQVFQAPEQAGSTLLNLEVTDLDGALAELAGRGLTAGEVQSGAQNVRFAALHDPDGNRITLIENPVT